MKKILRYNHQKFSQEAAVVLKVTRRMDVGGFVRFSCCKVVCFQRLQQSKNNMSGNESIAVEDAVMESGNDNAVNADNSAKGREICVREEIASVSTSCHTFTEEWMSKMETLELNVKCMTERMDKMSSGITEDLNGITKSTMDVKLTGISESMDAKLMGITETINEKLSGMSERMEMLFLLLERKTAEEMYKTTKAMTKQTPNKKNNRFKISKRK